MPELRVVAVSSDGSRLVLKAADATEYTLPIDERLRAAVRGDRPRLGQIDVESHLRPRDIQARIRAGASAEEVAQLAGISVERVRRFEGPVLAERAFMAERARKTAIRRQGESTGPQLGDAVAERLLLRGAEKDSAVWDSWRRDDGTWEVILGYRADSRQYQASWTYDPPRRLVQANNDEARALIGEGPERALGEGPVPFVPRIARLPRERGTERPGAGGGAGAGERPTGLDRAGLDRAGLDRAGLDRTGFDRERDRDRERERTAEPPAAATGDGRDSLTSLLDVVPNFRGDLEIGADAPNEVPTEESPAEDAEVPPAAQAPAASAGSAYADILMPRSVKPHRDRLVGTTDRQAEADGVRPGRRAAVPSWDEIVFGTRRKKQE